MGSGSASAGKKGMGAVNLEEAMKNMKLKDSELDDVFVGEEEISELSKAARWLAVARVNTRKPFSADAFRDTMKFAWRLANEPEIREAEDNLFVIQLLSWGLEPSNASGTMDIQGINGDHRRI